VNSILQKVFSYFGSIKSEYLDLGLIIHNLFHVLLSTNNLKTHQEICKLLNNFRKNSSYGVDLGSSVVRDAWREKNLVFINQVCEKCLSVFKSEEYLAETINLAIQNGFEGLSLPYEMTCSVVLLLQKIWISENKILLLRDRLFLDYINKLISSILNQKYSEFIIQDQILINFISNVFPEISDTDNLVISLMDSFKSLVKYLGQTLNPETKQALVTHLIVYYSIFPIFFQNASIKEKFQKNCQQQLSMLKKLVNERETNGWASVQDITALLELVKRVT